MLNLHASIFLIRVVFHSFITEKKFGLPHFFAFLTQVTYYLIAVKVLKSQSTRKFWSEHPQLGMEKVMGQRGIFSSQEFFSAHACMYFFKAKPPSRVCFGGH